jgi:hypothetical protein
MCLHISECNALPHAWSSSAGVKLLPGNIYGLDFSLTISSLSKLGSEDNGLAVCISGSLNSPAA